MRIGRVFDDDGRVELFHEMVEAFIGLVDDARDIREERAVCRTIQNSSARVR